MRVGFPSGERTGISLKTSATLAATGSLIWATESVLISPIVPERELAWALSIAVVSGSGLAVLLVAVVFLRIRDARFEKRAQRVVPEIRRAITQSLSNPDFTDTIAGFLRSFPSETERSFRAAFQMVKGDGLRRLVEVGRSVGLLKVWQTTYARGRTRDRTAVIRPLACLMGDEGPALLAGALRDADPDVRMEAARALAELGGEDHAEVLYEFARTRSLLVKAMIAEDLRAHLTVLTARMLPADLTSGSPDRLGHALDMLTAWSLPVPVCLDPALRNPNPEIRVRALRLLDWIHISDQTPGWVRRNLKARDEATIEAAALAAGRLKMNSLIPDLAVLLSGADTGVCRAAARALSAMGHVGPLQDKVRTGESPAAEAALEAIQRAHTGRGEYSRV